MLTKIARWLKDWLADAFEPMLSGAWDGGEGTAERRRRAASGGVLVSPPGCTCPGPTMQAVDCPVHGDE